ncbi:unnamed protein product [Phytophthora fragariaefolia]|uniref:Unnamed protein product n=1 Tax=Phytophthora fragariaefolia TaxID=1490495 RepID=A0A9W7CMS1_9STRA|nr:unnamed protein product [Phytophthora fragariaefolia]
MPIPTTIETSIPRTIIAPTPRTITSTIPDCDRDADLKTIAILISAVIGMLIPRMIPIPTHDDADLKNSHDHGKDHDYDRGRDPNLDPDPGHMVLPKWCTGIIGGWKPVQDTHGNARYLIY